MLSRNRKGMTIPLVLVLSFALLVLGGAYFNMMRGQKPVNEKVFERSQADFLAQGLVELAALKFKKRPAEFYYAYRARQAGVNSGPFTNYVPWDPTLNGTFSDSKGQVYDYATDWELVTNKAFEVDGIRVTVTVTQRSPIGAIEIVRTLSHTIQANRRML